MGKMKPKPKPCTDGQLTQNTSNYYVVQDCHWSKKKAE